MNNKIQVGHDGVFKETHTVSLSNARRPHVKRIIELLEARNPLRNALDVGCGIGQLSDVLLAPDRQVVACDLRKENIEIAVKEQPGIDFRVRDIEASSFTDIGEFDFVLCLGLLYHLENPFKAIRNLASVTRHALLISTVVAPGNGANAVFVDEYAGEDQAANYVALVPTERGYVKMLYRAGFSSVYKLEQQPDHPDFTGRLFRRKRRAMYLAVKSDELHIPDLVRLNESFARHEQLLYANRVCKKLDNGFC